MIFALCIVFVYLILSAQYESYPHVPGTLTEAEAARQIRERVRQMDGGEYYAVVTVENPYV